MDKGQPESSLNRVAPSSAPQIALKELSQCKELHPPAMFPKRKGVNTIWMPSCLWTSVTLLRISGASLNEVAVGPS
jgi:hypothetical protein